MWAAHMSNFGPDRLCVDQAVKARMLMPVVGELQNRAEFRDFLRFWYDSGMHDILVVLVHSIVTVVRLMKPGGLRAVVESALTRHQLLILNRSRKRAPSLRVSDRIIAGLCTLLMHPSRILRCGIVLKPATLLHFHHLLTKRKYHMLFSAKRGG